MGCRGCSSIKISEDDRPESRRDTLLTNKSSIIKEDKTYINPRAWEDHSSDYNTGNRGCGFTADLKFIRTYRYPEMVAATGNFNSDNFLREERFGKVYKGYHRVAKSRQMVAIKQLHQGINISGVRVGELSCADHPNLVKLIGYCQKGSQTSLVNEYMPLGSLEHHLHGRPPSDGKPLDWNTRMKIAAGAARGLDYLHHSMEPPMVHANLKCSNILLGEGYEAKLSDFGLAPTPTEATKSDIYTFGLILLEIITGRKAIDRSGLRGEPNLLDWAKPLFENSRKFGTKFVDPSLEGRYPTRALHRALSISALCLHNKPELRPSISDVVVTLDHLASQTYDPIINIASKCSCLIFPCLPKRTNYSA